MRACVSARVRKQILFRTDAVLVLICVSNAKEWTDDRTNERTTERATDKNLRIHTRTHKTDNIKQTRDALVSVWYLSELVRYY